MQSVKVGIIYIWLWELADKHTARRTRKTQTLQILQNCWTQMQSTYMNGWMVCKTTLNVLYFWTAPKDSQDRNKLRRQDLGNFQTKTNLENDENSSVFLPIS